MATKKRKLKWAVKCSGKVRSYHRKKSSAAKHRPVGCTVVRGAGSKRSRRKGGKRSKK